MSASKKILIAIHDVAPHHLHRLKSAEQLLMDLGINRVALLFIPNFHGHGLACDDGEFVTWCNKKRALEFVWFLHGYSHLEDISAGKRTVSRSGDGLKRWLLTNNEGEFLSLDRLAARSRLKKAKEIFASVLPGVNPAGFIAPGWLFNEELFSVLTEEKMIFTEDHHRIYQIEKKKQYRCPVITWATRTFFYEYGSRLINPLLLHYWHNRNCLRIALHPMDFDFPKTVDNIKRVLRSALGHREVVSYFTINKEL